MFPYIGEEDWARYVLEEKLKDKLFTHVSWVTKIKDFEPHADLKYNNIHTSGQQHIQTLAMGGRDQKEWSNAALDPRHSLWKIDERALPDWDIWDAFKFVTFSDK